MLSPLSACSFIYITMDSQDSYFIHVHLYSLLSQCTDSRECTPAPLIPGSSSLSPVPRPSQAAGTLALRFSISFWPRPGVSPRSLCTGPRWSLVTPAVPAPHPWSCRALLKGFFHMCLAGFCCVLRRCFWLGSEHLCCLGVCVCPFVCTLLRVHSILWLTRVVGFRIAWLAPRFLPSPWLHTLGPFCRVLCPLSSVLHPVSVTFSPDVFFTLS